MDDIKKNLAQDDEQGDAEGLDMSGLGDLDALLGLADVGEVDELSDLGTEDIELSAVDPEQETVFLDAVSQMSEEEIEKLLVGAGEMPQEDEPLAMDDSEVREIQELLSKSDNNEIIDAESAAFAAGALGEADALRAAIEGGDSVATVDKKQQKELDKQQKKAQRAAKKAEREAERARKKEERLAAKAKKKDKDADKGEVSENTGLDTDALDSIVFGAEHLGKEMQADNVSPVGVSTFGAVEEATDAASDEADSLGVDFGNLFGSDIGDSDLALGAADADFEAAIAASVSAEKNDKNAGEEASKEKKKNKGFFAKLLNFLLEEEEEPEEKGTEDILLSQENEGILKDLDAGKGKKNKKDKKNKKGKKVNSDAEGKSGDDDSEGEQKKSKKQKKPKKEKKLKEEKVPVLSEPGNKLGFKKVMPVVVLGITIFAVIWISGSVSTDYAEKKTAREAYYSGDYQTCYENLFGKELDETEEVMFGKSKSILYMRLWYREYLMFAEEGLKVEALDSLIQTVNAYPELYEYAQQWNATQEVYEIYADILHALSEQYGITEVQALEIAATKRDKIYTKVVTTLANGGTYGSWGGSTEVEVPEEDKVPDELPEESGMGQGNFVDNR